METHSKLTESLYGKQYLCSECATLQCLILCRTSATVKQVKAHAFVGHVPFNF